jgi:hypothetical protein
MAYLKGCCRHSASVLISLQAVKAAECRDYMKGVYVRANVEVKTYSLSRNILKQYMGIIENSFSLLCNFCIGDLR